MKIENVNEKKNGLIEFYKEYIYLEDLNSAKIDPSRGQIVSEPLFINFSAIKENNQNNTYLDLEDNQKNEILKKFPIQKDNAGNDLNKIFMFFPLIKVVEKSKNSSKEYLYPLFAIDVTEHKSKLESDDFQIPLEFLSNSNYQPIFNTFNRFLGIEEDFFSENIALSYLLNNIMKTKFSSAKNVIEYFLKYLDIHLKEGDLFYKFGLVSKLEINYLSKNLKYELDAIKNSDIKYMPLIKKYLFNEHDYSLPKNKFIEDNRTIWKGSFGDYALSKGQARVLQNVSKGEDLTSVIGAPGTGKTTLFLSVIASQIVDRALHIINRGVDKKNFIFITSTSNKAVNNVIDEFKTLFKDRKDFYFIGGKKDNIEESKNRILNFIEELENNDDKIYSLERQNKLKEEILQINEKMSEIQIIFLKQEELEREKEYLNEKYATLKVLKEELKQIPKKEGEESLFIKKLEDIENKKVELEAKKKLYKEKKETIDYVYNNLYKTYNFTDEFLVEKDLYNILTGPFLKELNKLGHKLLSVNPFHSLFEFVFKKKEFLIEQFKKENALFVNGMGTEVTVDNIFYLADMAEKLTFYYEEELKDLNLDSLKTSELLDKELDILFKDTITMTRSKKLLRKEIDELLYKRNNSQGFLTEAKEQKIKVKSIENELTEYKDLFSKYTNFTNYFRERFVLENKKLYELSNDYMAEEVLRNKDKVIYYLRLWIDLLDNKKSREEKKFIDFKEMYLTISMAYPVVTSTLASVSNNIKTDIYNKRRVKPYSLCLSDESGMISIETLLPALFRSEKAIVVGDPKQLEPIVTVSDSNKDELMNFIDNRDEFQRYSPTESTAFHRAAHCETGSYADIGNGILLDEHRRCHTDIANLFKEIAGYKDLEIKTNPLSEEDALRLNNIGLKPLSFINVEGKAGKYDNTNKAELDAINKVLNELSANGVDIRTEVGIITPFSNQETLLLESFGRKINHSFGNEKIGTVHKFQGAEFNFIIFSSVIFGKYNKASFINLKPNLLNVAVSRAKQALIHIGDESTLSESGGYLGIMMKHYDIYGKKFLSVDYLENKDLEVVIDVEPEIQVPVDEIDIPDEEIQIKEES